MSRPRKRQTRAKADVGGGYPSARLGAGRTLLSLDSRAKFFHQPGYSAQASATPERRVNEFAFLSRGMSASHRSRQLH
jgi:hypothetical protein